MFNEYVNFHMYSNHLIQVNALEYANTEFSAAPTAQKKFMFTRDLLKKLGVLAKDLPRDTAISKTKDLISSEDFSLGNILFRSKKYKLSLNEYSRSVINSKPGTEFHALALANRSAAFFKIKQYINCLKDIRRSLESNYPAALVYKLYLRAGRADRILGNGELAKENYVQCLKHLDRSVVSEEVRNMIRIEATNATENCDDLVKQVRFVEKRAVECLVGGENEKIPALSNFVELKSSKTMGRGIYATCDINPGDVVAVDESYVGGPSLKTSFLCNYNNCLRMCLAVIPCPKCLLVVYCGEECLQKASEDGHNFECSILNSIRSLPGIPKVNVLVTKWFLKEFTKMDLKSYCSVVTNFSKTKFDPESRGLDGNGQYKSDSFLTAYSLESNEEKLPLNVIFFLNCVAVEMLNYLMLSGVEIPKCCMATVGVSLVHMLNIIDYNCWKLNMNAPSLPMSMNKDMDKVPIAYTLYPSISLFNHSCDPNVKQSGILNERIIVLKATQPIPKGSQLCVSYGFCFKKHSKQMRENNCMDKFNFMCLCQPCLQNWPTDRYIPKRLSTLNLLNLNMVDIVITECKKFREFSMKVNPQNYHLHLNYLYFFIKLLFENVKRPFALYEECLQMICNAHILIRTDDNGFFSY